ncbi:MAG: zinc-ribbon domain-containing protein [Alphaproteobacteria bacterium]|nr:zinc-ribbon domain-containing protein [Alphaproteobacteria bacterium]
MIVVCPECDSRYNIKAEVISVDGRVLKCANCQHDWFHGGVSLHDMLDEEGDDVGAAASLEEDYDDDLGVKLDDIEEALEDELLDDDLYDDAGEIDIAFSEEDSQIEASELDTEDQDVPDEGFAAILDKVGLDKVEADILEPKAGKREKEKKKRKVRKDTKVTGNVLSGVFVDLLLF